MKSFEDIQAEAESDLKFDINNLEHYALTIGKIKEKYLRYIQTYRMKLKKAIFQLDKVYAERHTWHSTQNPRSINRHDIDTYIKADTDYRKVSAEVCVIEEQVKYLDGILKTLDNMSFTINSAVKLHIFKNGG